MPLLRGRTIKYIHNIKIFTSLGKDRISHSITLLNDQMYVCRAISNFHHDTLVEFSWTEQQTKQYTKTKKNRIFQIYNDTIRNYKLNPN